MGFKQVVSLMEIRRCLENDDRAAILQYAGSRKRILSLLTALTFDPVELVGWRAVEGHGPAAAIIATMDAEYVRSHLRRLFWQLSDESGSIGWRAPEIIGMIIATDPALYAGFIPPLLSLLSMEEEDAPRFRAGVLWALSCLGSIDSEIIQPVLPLVLASLQDPQPRVRAEAIGCLQESGFRIPVDVRVHLQADHSRVTLFRERRLIEISISTLVSR